MAVTASALLASGSSADATSFAPGSITPGANRLVLALVTNSHGSLEPNEVTLTGGGMTTWTQVRTDLYDLAGAQSRMTLFRALQASPGSGALTAATSPSQTSTGWNVKVVEFAGIETAGTNGSGAVPAGVFYSRKGTTSLTGWSVTIDDFPFDATAGFVVHQFDEAVTPEEGWSLVGTRAGHATPAEAVDAVFLASRDRTVSASWVSSGGNAGVYGIPIFAMPVSGGGGGVGSPPVATPTRGVAWFDGVTVVVEAGFAAATSGSFGVWDSAVWDSSTWGADSHWSDISQYVRSVQTRRRFARDVQAWETGEATVVLDNRDGRFSPSNLTGPYVTGGVTQIRPWRPIRFRMVYGGETFDVYTGYAVSWTERYARGNVDAAVTVACVDEQARLAMCDGYEQAEQGAGESTGRRVHRVLDNVGFTGSRNVATGVVTCQATTLADNAVTELKLAADSEGGALWVETDGSVWFADQFALLESARSNTVQATFTDGPGDLLPMRDVTPADSGDLLANMVAFARRNGVTQLAADASSRALYGDLRYSRTDLIAETDTQVAGVADFYLARYKDPEDRFASIQVTPRTRPVSLVPNVLGLRVRDRIQVVHRHPAGHTITRNNFVAGVSHSISPGGHWDTTFDLMSATPYDPFTASRWDVAVWDEDVWFF